MQYTILRQADMLHPTMPEWLPFPLHGGDGPAHTFQIEVERGGKPLSLNGYSVSAIFHRSDGADVIFSGQTEEHGIRVTLPPSCYRSPGEGTLLVRLVSADGGEQCTVYACFVNVLQEKQGEIIDPEQRIPTLETLLQQAEKCESAAEAARCAAEDVTAKLNSGALDGRGLTVLGTVGDPDGLPTESAIGDAWGVGQSAPYDLWIFTRKGWVSFGPLSAGSIRVNGAVPDRTGSILLTGEDLAVSSDNTSTVSRALEELKQKTGRWELLASGTFAEGSQFTLPSGLSCRAAALRTPYGYAVMHLPGDGGTSYGGLIGSGYLYAFTLTRSGSTLSLAGSTRQTVSASGSFGARNGATVTALYLVP